MFFSLPYALVICRLFLFIKLCLSWHHCQYHYQSQEYSLKVLRISLWWIWLLPDYNFEMKAHILLLAISLTVFFKCQAYFFLF